MIKVNMLEAKTNFSKLIRLLENKEEDEIIVCRDNDPVVKIIRFEKPQNKRIGVAKGFFGHVDLDEFNSLN